MPLNIPESRNQNRVLAQLTEQELTISERRGAGDPSEIWKRSLNDFYRVETHAI